MGAKHGEYLRPGPSKGVLEIPFVGANNYLSEVLHFGNYDPGYRF